MALTSNKIRARPPEPTLNLRIGSRDEDEEEEKKVYYNPMSFKHLAHHRNPTTYTTTSFNPRYQRNKHYDMLIEEEQQQNTNRDLRFEGSAYFIESSVFNLPFSPPKTTKSTAPQQNTNKRLSNNNSNVSHHTSSTTNTVDQSCKATSSLRHIKLAKSVKFSDEDAIDEFMRMEPMRCMYCVGRPSFSRFWRELKVLEKETSRAVKKDNVKFNDTTYISFNYFTPKDAS
jgi:hypothetical protein